eukprot:901586-Amphidinium_carterae.1
MRVDPGQHRACGQITTSTDLFSSRYVANVERASISVGGLRLFASGPGVGYGNWRVRNKYTNEWDRHDRGEGSGL